MKILKRGVISHRPGNASQSMVACSILVPYSVIQRAIGEEVEARENCVREINEMMRKHYRFLMLCERQRA